MMYRVTGEQLTGIAGAIRAKTGSSEQIAFPDGFEEQIGTLTDTSDADITADDVKLGKFAYGSDGQRIEGTYEPQISYRYNVTKGKKFTVKATGGSYPTGHVFYTYEKPDNEIWSAGSMNLTLSGTNSSYASATLSNNVITVKATRSLPMPSASDWTLTYRALYVIDVT